jgi:L-seryl-tRNA(Ser) seleniumtransferase
MGVARNAARSAPVKSGERTRRLRELPPLDECLRALATEPSAKGLAAHYLKDAVRRALTSLREDILGGEAGLPVGREAMVAEAARRASAMVAGDEPALRAVVNATGVILHSNLGRALLAEEALQAIELAARSPVNLEYDLEAGTRGDRDTLVEGDLCRLTGAEAATVVNNNAAAVLLVLNSLAEGREVVVSRGELIEIGGSFRLPDVMARSGARLREVGTTNRTHPGDYASAIGPETALLLKVHPSNYRIVGFTCEVGLGELVELGRAHGVAVVEDLGAGALVDLTHYGLPREPVVAQRIAAGAALVTFSGDKLLGGPQAGIIAGKRDLVERVRSNPLKRALRCDKLTLAALSATLRLYLRSERLSELLPVLAMMRRDVDELGRMAAAAREILAERLDRDFTIEIVPSTAQVGSGSLPGEELESRALKVTHQVLSAGMIAALFRRARPPVIGRISDGAFLLDLRAVEQAASFAVVMPEGPIPRG